MGPPSRCTEQPPGRPQFPPPTCRAWWFSPRGDALKAPPDHLFYLRRRPFLFECSTSIFPSEEYNSLAEYGNWMQALVQGVIQPKTPAQEHFLRADREEVAPETVRERAWARLKSRREFERVQRMPPPPTPLPGDYGIVEWDADRWW